MTVIVRSILTRRRGVLSVLVGASLAVLTGCGGVHPGAAAVVGSSTITDSQVDDLAAALCSVNISSAKAQGQPAPQVAAKGARLGALQVLLESTLSTMYGRSVGVHADRHRVSQALRQNEQGISRLPGDQRDDFRAALKHFSQGQLMLIAAGRRSLTRQGKHDVTDQQAIAEGQRLRSRYVKGLDVEVDPRYGTYADGQLKAGGNELSFAASQSAKQGDMSQPPSSWVASLPASQKCS